MYLAGRKDTHLIISYLSFLTAPLNGHYVALYEVPWTPYTHRHLSSDICMDPPAVLKGVNA